jgi:hypothetical protein
MVSVLLTLGAALGWPQGMPGADVLVGKITAVNGTTLTVAPLTGGDPVTVKIGDSTRVFKDRQPARAADIKAGDFLFAQGKMNGKTMEAAMVSLPSAENLQRIRQGMAQLQISGEDLGKKFIAGEVKAINELKLTIARPDNQTQEIEVDETTSFRKGRESVTLADIKTGDFVRGAGDLKNGVFVPKELIIGRLGTIGGFGGGGGPRGPGGPGQGAMMNPADLGKTFIAGRVKAVAAGENKITVSRMDGETQEIQLDKSTALKKMPGGAAITLADVKTGDMVRGPGELKEGVFVPRELTFGTPRNAPEAGTAKPSTPLAPKN